MKNEEPSKKASGRFEAMVGRICIRALMIIIPIVVLDYASSFFISHHSRIEKKYGVQTVRQPQPYTMFGGAENGRLDTGEILNARGYRGELPPEPKEAGEYRIFVLGGSTVFNGDPPISVLLEEEFKRNGKANVAVYNFGVVSSVSRMELVRILLEISDLAPDLIIMYNGGNDILTPRAYDPRPGYPFNFMVYDNNPLLESDLRSYPSLNLMLYGSNLARYFLPEYFLEEFVPLEAEREMVEYGSDKWKDEIVEIYVSNVRKAHRISAVFGAECIAFFQPMVYYKDHPTKTEEELMKEEDKGYYADMRDRIRSKIDTSAAETMSVIVDLSDIYDEFTEEVNIDCIHTMQKHKNVVAEAIYSHIASNFEVN